MSSSNSDPSTGSMFATTVPATVSAEDEHRRAKFAREEFDKEVDDFRKIVFGQAGPPVLPSADKIGPDMFKYAKAMQVAQDGMIRHTVLCMRGIALQGQTVGGNAVKAAGLANAAWDCSQKHLQAWGKQQMHLHRALHNLRESLGCLLDGEKLEKAVMMEHVNLVDAALEDQKALEDAMNDAEELLLERARVESEATGKPIRTGETFADDITARTVGQHGSAIAGEVMGEEPRIQIAQPGTKLPSWSKRTKRGRQ